MRIALYFGSFNPIHNGHIGLAQFIMSNTDMEQLWLVPSPQNPLKVHQTLLDNQARIEMAQLAVADLSGVFVCDVECSLPTPNYTIVTLQTLKQRYPEHDFTLIIGADNMAIFNRWKNYQDILQQFRVMVYPRQGYPFSNADYPSMQLIKAPLFNVSSTQVREAVKAGLSIDAMVPPQVATEIKAKGYYR